MNVIVDIYKIYAVFILIFFGSIITTSAQNDINTTAGLNLPLTSLAMVTVGWENERQLPDFRMIRKADAEGKKTTPPGKPDLQLPNPPIIAPSLINFSSIVSNSNVILQWKTSALPDADELIVEQSENEVQYKEVSAVRLNIGEKVNGIIIPQEDGISHYRLKILNKDGSAVYTESLSCTVNMTASGTVSVHPAFITDEWLTALTIVTGYRGKIKVVITDDHGHQLIEFHREIISEMSKIPIGVATIPKGTYYIFVSGKDGARIGPARELIRS